MTSYGVSAENVTESEVVTLAEHVGVCTRPVVRRMTDRQTGEQALVPVPCGSTRERVCKPCADKARRIRIQQCREGWHRTDDPADPAADGDTPDAEDDNAAEDDEVSTPPRRRRSTKRREDAPELPKCDMAATTLGRAFTGRDGRTYRPSMFLTFTLGSYGPVNDDGTPKHPRSYDYRRAALDAMHFPKLVDRLMQNLRRCAGYNAQYFATVESQKRLALHLHAAIRGTMSRAVVRQVIAATYHQVWWPNHDTPVYTGGRLPVWDEPAGQYVDPATRQPLQTWDQALDQLDKAADDDGADPAHVSWFGSQFDYQGVLATNEAEVRRSVGYLTKYLTKSVAETYDPDTITARQKAHRDRLHAEIRYLPCTPECANWLRFGIQPKDAEEGMCPGECSRPAHHSDNLGHGGRRVLVSRDWSGKRLPEHKADRAAVVRETLAAAGVDMPDADRCSATAITDDGEPRFQWDSVDITRDTNPHAYRDLIRQTIRERTRWRHEYDTARSTHPPPDIRSANQPDAAPAA